MDQLTLNNFDKVELQVCILQLPQAQITAQESIRMAFHGQRSKQRSGMVSFTPNTSISQSHLLYGYSPIIKVAAAIASSCIIPF
jgi:hypothetical protein